MKPILLAISTLILLASATAQTTDHHKWYVSAGTGIYGNNPLLPLKTVTNGELIAKPQHAFNVGIRYFANKNFAIGLSGGYYSFKSSYEHVVSAGAPAAADYVQQYTTTAQYRKIFCIAAEATVVYKHLKNNDMAIYGTVAIGVDHNIGYDYYDRNDVYPNQPPMYTCGFGWSPKTNVDENKMTANISPIGIRGGNRLCWYGELGYGYKGILNVGVGYKL